VELDRVSRLQRNPHRLGRTEHPGKLRPDRSRHSSNNGVPDRRLDRNTGPDHLAQSAGHGGDAARRARELRPALRGLLLALAAGITLAGPAVDSAGYAPFPAVVSSVRSTTSRVPTAFPTGADHRAKSAAIPGYLSSWGLPPVEGHFIVSDSALVFQSSEGATSMWSPSVSLAYVDRDQGRSHYLFRIDAGVFETDAPGPLLRLAEGRGTVGSRPVPLAGSVRGSAATPKTIQEIATSAYADTLYRLFGKPQAPLGTVGPRGQRAGRLGEYIAASDSLTLDPERMTGEAQLRHAMAHELGHRWQAHAKAQLTALWVGVLSIRDPKRYGYGERSEHQAEAIAFAVHYLQTTAGSRGPAAASLTLLDHYELLVPGTRTIARYLSLQPVYRRHPLRSVLTTRHVTHALEK
jgi:hypothetical protein